MTLWNVLAALAAFIWSWFTWRTVQTGTPMGNPKISPRREERPAQFWLIVAILGSLAIFAAVRAANF